MEDAQGRKPHGDAFFVRIGVVTVLGGSIMPPEVVQAMEEASRHFVSLPDLQKKAGTRIAELLGVPGAMITGGAAGRFPAGRRCLDRGARVCC